MHRCEHFYVVKFDRLSGITAECTFCQDVKRLKRRYAVIGYSIGWFISSLLLVLLQQLNVADLLILVLLPSFIIVYDIISWIMYKFIAKACQQDTGLFRYFSIPEK